MVQIFPASAPLQRGTHFVGDAAAKPFGLQGAEEEFVIDESFAHGNGDDGGGLRFVVDEGGLIFVTRTKLVIGDGCVDSVAAEESGGGLEIGALESRGPGVEKRFQIRRINGAQNVVQSFETGADVVVVLETQRDAEFTGAAGGFFQGVDDQIPLLRETRVRGFVPGENADDRDGEILGEAAEFGEVGELNFFVGNVAAIKAGGEITVSGQNVVIQVQIGELVAELFSLSGVVVERGDVGALGHQHYAAIAKCGGVGDEGIDRQKGLAPEAGVTDRMEQKWMGHRLVLQLMVTHGEIFTRQRPGRLGVAEEAEADLAILHLHGGGAGAGSSGQISHRSNV